MAPLTVGLKQFSESMKSETEFYLESVMQAVNSAPDGEWIAASEEQVWNFVTVSSSRRCINGSMRRNPLFPPPTDTIVDPLNEQREANKGHQATHVLTFNERIEPKWR